MAAIWAMHHAAHDRGRVIAVMGAKGETDRSSTAKVPFPFHLGLTEPGVPSPRVVTSF